MKKIFVGALIASIIPILASAQVLSASAQVLGASAQVLSGEDLRNNARFFDNQASSGYGSNTVAICFRGITLHLSAFVVPFLLDRGATLGACNARGTLVINKVAESDSDAAASFSFTGDHGMGTFNVNTFEGSGSRAITLGAGTYHISENPKRGWSEVDSDCDTVVVTAGQTTTCTVTNSQSALPGSISGITFFTNANGSGNPTFFNREGGVRVYVDLNNNGVWDSGTEPSSVSNFFGQYSFTGVPAGTTFHIREVVPSGRVQLQPAGGQYVITLSSGQNLGGNNFGNR